MRSDVRLTMSVLITTSRARVPDVHSTKVEEFKMGYKGTEITTLGHCYAVADPGFPRGRRLLQRGAPIYFSAKILKEIGLEKVDVENIHFNWLV